MKQLFFFGAHKDDAIIKNSSSGGAFTAITDAWFEEYGDSAVVYGCVMDSDLKAKHVRATDAAGRDLMRGSKYIPSDMKGIYQQISDDLKDGRYVLFSGTPCQTAAVKSYLDSVKTEAGGRLLTVDFICHGVAEFKFFRDYVDHLEKKYKSRAVLCSFREKNRLGKLQAMKVVFENGKQFVSPSTGVDWFYTAYYRNLVIRPVCFDCKFASVERVSDITLGDYWRKDNVLRWGESLIICNTENGKACIDKLADTMTLCECEFDVKDQPQLCGASKKPENYEAFHKLYTEQGYLTAQKYLGNNTFKGRVKYSVSYILDKLKLIVILKKIKNKFSTQKQ